MQEKSEADVDRPDLTELKAAVIQRFGGRCFEKHDLLPTLISPSLAKHLLAKGEFCDGKEAVFHGMPDYEIPQDERERYGLASDILFVGKAAINSLILAIFANFDAWTGFALSENGVWTAHSWCVGRRSRRRSVLVLPIQPRAGQIVETNEPKKSYFGIRRSIPPFFKQAAGDAMLEVMAFAAQFPNLSKLSPSELRNALTAHFDAR